MKYIFIVLLLFPVIADAALYLDVNGISKHIATNQNYNERNPGLGLTYQNVGYTVYSSSVGFYKNSLDRTSEYAAVGIAKRTHTTEYYQIGLIGGVVTGYDYNAVALLAIKASTGTKQYHISMLYTPATQINASTLMMDISFRIQ